MAKTDALTALPDVHVGAYMSPADVGRIDAWAKSQLDGDGISRSQAFRALVMRGLAASGPGSRWARRTKSDKA